MAKHHPTHHPTTAPIPTIPPEAALRAGRADPLALLCIWYVRKASYGILALGIIVGLGVGRGQDIAGGVNSAEEIWRELWSPLAGIILGVMVRVGAGFVALVLAYPLARDRERGLEPRAYLGSGLTGWLDRLHAARAYRSLRWTHHVRQVAIRRLGQTGRRLARLDPIMDALNVTLFVIAILTAIVLGGSSA